MLEEYLKRLENLITPRSFSLTNFKEQQEQLQNTLNTQNTQNIQNAQNTQNVVKNRNSIIMQKPIIENNEVISQVGNTILSNNQNNHTDNSKIRLNLNEGEILPENFREIVHQLKIKNMNYRHDIHILKQKIDDYEKQIAQKDNLIKKLQKQKEDDNKYLLKLEGVRAKDGVNIDAIVASLDKRPSSTTFEQNKEKTSTQEKNLGLKEEKLSERNIFSQKSVSQFSPGKNNFNNESQLNISINNITGTAENLKGLNVNDKKAVKEFAMKLMAENKRLKGFQAKIYEVSKNYDTLNEKITKGLSLIKKYFEEISNLNNVEGSTLCNMASKI